jgi:hypothetical protein
MRIFYKSAAVAAFALLSPVLGTQVRAAEPEIAVVVRIGGSQQARAVEDLIARNVSPIGVVPNDAITQKE